jgi:hypothetical protein
VAELNKHYAFQCRKLGAMHISQVEELYVITKVKGELIVDGCMDKITIENILQSGPGSLEIRIPCACELFVNGSALISKLFPCDRRGVKEME